MSKVIYKYTAPLKLGVTSLLISKGVIVEVRVVGKEIVVYTLNTAAEATVLREIQLHVIMTGQPYDITPEMVHHLTFSTGMSGEFVGHIFIKE